MALINSGRRNRHCQDMRAIEKAAPQGTAFSYVRPCSYSRLRRSLEGTGLSICDRHIGPPFVLKVWFCDTRIAAAPNPTPAPVTLLRYGARR